MTVYCVTNSINFLVISELISGTKPHLKTTSKTFLSH